MLLVEGPARGVGQWKGRTDTNRIAVFDTKNIAEKVPVELYEKIRSKQIKKSEFDNLIDKELISEKSQSIEKGDYILVRVDNVTNKTLLCTPVAHTNMNEFFYSTQKKPFFTLE